jgi:5-hydroxyisourate hydrolase
MTLNSPITTHVLDTSRGRPAEGVAVLLEVQNDQGHWQPIGEGVTDEDGRVGNLLLAGALGAGRYRLMFLTGDYYARQGVTAFYPAITIEFQVNAPDERYHVPLLLSPFGYSTYRGS